MKTRVSKNIENDPVARKRSDVITGRIMTAFSVACVGLIAVFLLDRLAGLSVETNLSLWLGVAGLAVAAVGAALWIARSAKGTDESVKVLRGTGIVIAGLTMAACMFGLYFGGSRLMTLVYFVIAAVGGLYVIYYIYRKEFFVSAMLACVAVSGIYTMRKLLVYGARNVSFWVTLAFTVIVLALTLAAAFNKKNQGVLPIGKSGVRMCHFDSRGIPVYIMAAAAVAALVISMFLPAYGLYMIFVLAGVTLVFGIYYTVKMI